MWLLVFQALEFDREGLTKLKKAVKAIYNSGNSKLNDMFTVYVSLAFTAARMLDT